MRTAKIVSIIGLLAMSAVLFYGFTRGDFGSDGAALLRNPWGIVSMVDLYTGFMLFSAWIVFREGSLWRSLPWVFAMLVLGFFTGSLYTLFALISSRGDWQQFWMGARSRV